MQAYLKVTFMRWNLCACSCSLVGNSFWYRGSMDATQQHNVNLLFSKLFVISRGIIVLNKSLYSRTKLYHSFCFDGYR